MDSSNEARLLLFVSLLGVLFGLMRRAAGKLAPSVTLGPIVFLVTRVPVLIGWGIGAAGMAALLLPGAIRLGHTGPSDLATLVGLSLFCGLGFAALTVGPLWGARQAFVPAPTFPLEPGEVLIEELAANHFLNGEARGGKALITNRRLGFRPHRFNVQLDLWSAQLDAIKSSHVEGDRFLVVNVEGSASPAWLVIMNPEVLRARLSQLAALPERERATTT